MEKQHLSSKGITGHSVVFSQDLYVFDLGQTCVLKVRFASVKNYRYFRLYLRNPTQLIHLRGSKEEISVRFMFIPRSLLC